MYQRNSLEEELLSRAWHDQAFSDRLAAAPREALDEVGGHLPGDLDLPVDLELKVVRDSDSVKYLHIPAAPLEGRLADDELMQAQGGSLNPLNYIGTLIPR